MARAAGFVLATLVLASCAGARRYSDLELFEKAARGETVHCWKRDSVISGPYCHHPGYEEPLRKCLVETGRTDWPLHSLKLAPGPVLVCMAREGWGHGRLEVTSGN